jgi:hypothetical protein
VIGKILAHLRLFRLGRQLGTVLGLTDAAENRGAGGGCIHGLLGKQGPILAQQGLANAHHPRADA